VALNLYLDDCANSDLLAQLLAQAGHTVVRPADAGTASETDQVHFHHAQGQGLVLITKNPKDFRVLHDQDQHHPGILGIYQDNDSSRDMSDADVVAAIANIEAAIQHGYQIAGEFHILNAWR
jgi:predicted nuclease of predicted toxin-antitoxin system